MALVRQRAGRADLGFRKAWYATWVNHVGIEPPVLAALAAARDAYSAWGASAKAARLA